MHGKLHQEGVQNSRVCILEACILSYFFYRFSLFHVLTLTTPYREACDVATVEVRSCCERSHICESALAYQVYIHVLYVMLCLSTFLSQKEEDKS